MHSESTRRRPKSRMPVGISCFARFVSDRACAIKLEDHYVLVSFLFALVPRTRAPQDRPKRTQGQPRRTRGHPESTRRGPKSPCLGRMPVGISCFARFVFDRACARKFEDHCVLVSFLLALVPRTRHSLRNPNRTQGQLRRSKEHPERTQGRPKRTQELPKSLFIPEH